MVARARLNDQRGFTLIEVLMGILLLLVGVLGVVAMVDTSNAVTSKTKAREGGTNLARSVIEVSRSIRYRDLTTTSLEEALAARPGLEDAVAAAGYTLRSRDVNYEMELSVCSLDDPKDGLGARPAGVTFCADSDAPVGTLRDRNPDDYKRVRVTLRWETRRTSQSITQTSSIINPVGGLGPSITGLTMIDPPSGAVNDQVRIDSEVPDATFEARTSTSAAQVTWSLKGALQGDATGGPTIWEFTWDFVDDDGDILWYDCNYSVQADAFDNQGRAGAPRALTVILNRRQPIAPTNVAGGRNGSSNGGFDRVDLQWSTNPECDVVGYRVYRSTDPTSDGTPITCLNQAEPTYTVDDECIDETAPAGVPLYYKVRAVDKLQDLSPREGDFSAQLVVAGINVLPTVPQGVNTCIGGDVDCVTPDGKPAPTGQVVVRWLPSLDADGTVAFYRIYRDGITYAHRHDSFFPDGPIIAWLEYLAPDGSPHEYRVTAVDDDFGESGLSDPVSAP
jgi:prepilin-type N-terminal cleavage/methylation domain-containing protein